VKVGVMKFELCCVYYCSTTRLYT